MPTKGKFDFKHLNHQQFRKINQFQSIQTKPPFLIKIATKYLKYNMPTKGKFDYKHLNYALKVPEDKLLPQHLNETAVFRKIATKYLKYYMPTK